MHFKFKSACENVDHPQNKNCEPTIIWIIHENKIPQN